jgi:hypothetical protein
MKRPFDRSIEPVERSRPHWPAMMPGARTRLQERGGRSSMALPLSPSWQHPWQVTLLWDAQRAVWTSRIKAGFLNGNCPVIETTVGAAKASGTNWVNFGINPLTEEPFFSSWVFSGSAQATAVASTQPINVPLYANPTLDMDWYAIGSDGDPSITVPEFFADLGVASSTQPTDQQIEEDPDAAASSLVQASVPAGARLLRQCDIVLHQPRVGLTSTVQLEPGIVTGQSNVTQTLGLANPDASDTLRVYGIGTWTAPAADASIDPLTGDYVENTYDEIVVATAYVMSPANTPAGSAPDETWTPFVSHNLFWNLSWAQPEFVNVTLSDGQNLSVLGELAGGVAAVAINFLTASLNDAGNDALNILNAASMAGFFWMATGGGTDSVFPAATSTVSAPSGVGLDKSGLLQARRIAAAQALLQASLDPDFPFVGQRFNLSLVT